MKQRIILRADANAQIATGHVFRLLALAEILKTTYEVLFCTQTTNEELLSTISSQVDQIIMIPERFEYCSPSEKELIAEIPFDLQDIIHKDDIVVTDGYWFRENYQQAIKKQGAKLVMIDDFANQHFYADAVINHAPGVTKDIYRGEPHTKYYLGLPYALIRKEFFEQAKPNQPRNAKTVFIAFGGSDPYGLSVKYTEYLLEQTDFQIHLVSTHLHKQTMLDRISQLKKLFSERLKIYNNLNAKELIYVLDNCIYAVVPSSTILYECLSRGLKCITGYYTQNQEAIFNGFLEKGVIFNVGNFLNPNKALSYLKNNDLANFKIEQSSIIDGYSCKRLKLIFDLLSNENMINIRLSKFEEMNLYYHWANDKEVRTNSFNQNTIEFNRHKLWFEKKLVSECSKLFYVESSGIPIGQIRFDKDDNGYWKIDYSVDSKFRGMGFGSVLVEKGVNCLKNIEYEVKIKAEVKTDNIASIRVFRKMNFHETTKGNAIYFTKN